MDWKRVCSAYDFQNSIFMVYHEKILNFCVSHPHEKNIMEIARAFKKYFDATTASMGERN